MSSFSSTDDPTESIFSSDMPEPHDTLSSTDAQSSVSHPADWQSPQWAKVVGNLNRRFKSRSLSRMFDSWQPEGGRNYGISLLAGLAVAQNLRLSPLQLALADLASGNELSRKRAGSVDWSDAVEEVLRTIDDARSPGKIDPLVIADALLWAYALPPLVDHISESAWKSLCQSLDALARHCLAAVEPSATGRLLGGCELPLVLRLRLGDLASLELVEQAADGLQLWCDAAEESIATAIRGGGRYGRLVLASVMRQRRLVEVVAKRRLKRRRLGTAIDLACWVAAMTRRDGTAVFSAVRRRDLREDVVAGGLFDAMKTLAPKLLGPAVDATLGLSRTEGRLAWAVSLPESLWHSELAGCAAVLPEWDVRRGRVYVDYGGEDFRIEVEYGRGTAITGHWEAMIEVDGAEQAPSGPWTHICEYSDDDAQYLEFEQRWTGGVRLQRQIMVLRDDRCALLADAVLRDADQPPVTIRYVGRTPLAETISATTEPDTNEIWLSEGSEKRRVLALSLQTNEWRVGPSAARVEITADQNLKIQTASQQPRDNGGNVFAPLWLDFQQRRFDRPRTYRQLTVGDELRIVDPDEAVAHRIQMGSEHWVTYRSLRGERNRTFLGKHLVADFYCARFHPGDGSLEDLLTVGDHDEDIARADAEADGQSSAE